LKTVPTRAAEPGGRGSAIALALFKARIAILIAALAATGLSLFSIFSTNSSELEGLSQLAVIPVLAWACGVYALLLSVRLTLIAVVAPLLATVWWIAALSPGGVWSGPHTRLAPEFFAVLAAGLLVAALQLHVMMAQFARAMDRVEAVGAASNAVLIGILVMLAAGAGIASQAWDLTVAHAIGVSVALMLAASFLLPPLAASFLPFNEAYIARLNRARERREWLISYFAILTVSRWAFATIGITAVFATIIYFDSTFAALWQVAMKPYAIAFAAIGLLAAIGLRDWRSFFSCGLPPFVMSLVGAWALTQFGFAPHYAAEISLLLGSAAGAGFVFFLAAPTTRYQCSGDPILIAFARALNETGAAVIILALALALALLAGALITNSPPAVTLLPLCHIASALVLFPAIAAALEDLFPRRRSLEELYRAR
jgi:hypothetical protein